MSQSILDGSAAAMGVGESALMSRSTRRRSRLIEARIFLDSAPSMGDVLFAVRFDAITNSIQRSGHKILLSNEGVHGCAMWHNGWRLIAKRFSNPMLPRHKKALSDIKSAEKKLRDARTKYRKTKDELAKAKKRVDEAQTRLVAAQDLYES
jgi:hypothetical protein